MASALVLQVKLVGTPEEADKMLHEIVVPMAKAQPGFQSGTWCHDGAGHGMGVMVFATAEEAEAAEGVVKPPPGGPEVISSGVWEVSVQA